MAEERQRRKFAGAVHDGIGQRLFALKTKLGVLRRLVHPEAQQKLLGEALAMIDQTMSDARSLTFELCPPVLYEIGLEPAVGWLAKHFSELYGIRFECHDDGMSKQLTDEVRGVVFQALRELMTNAVKHACADTVEIRLERWASSLVVTIEDNGRGFATKGDADPEEGIVGFGLFSIRERLQPLGGDIEIESSPGCGCRVSLRAPLEENGETEEADYECSGALGR